MRLSITYKLFIALAATAALIVAVLLATTQWSIWRGFADHLSRLELARMDNMVVALETIYRRDGNWSTLQGQQRTWHDTVRNSIGPGPGGRGRARPPPPHPSGPNANPPRPPNNPPNGRRPGPPPRGDPLFLGRRLALLDSTRTFVVGARVAERASAVRPIVVDDRTVGYLALARSRAADNATNQAFLIGQLKTMSWLALAAMAIIAIISFVLARHFLNPVHNIAAGARRLAAGDYATRVSVGRTDELGRLADDFNALAVKLDNSESARRQWVADTSHELRTPIAVLGAEVEALQDGVRKADPKTLSRLHTNIGQLTRLVADLNDLARADVGALAFSMAPVLLSDLVADVVADTAELFETKQISVEVIDDKPAATVIVGDPVRLRQLLGNLLSNAAQYTDDGGRVRVTLDQSGEDVVLVVEDSPPAPPEDALTQLFDRFYRAESSRNRASGGSGLGLAIAKAIVEAHSGTISAGRSDFGGLQVTIVLPQGTEN